LTCRPFLDAIARVWIDALVITGGERVPLGLSAA